jgi:hypothetical protein
MGRDAAISQMLSNCNAGIGLVMYNLVSTNPIQVAITMMAVKMGITNKIVLGLIIAFLL